MTELQFSPEAPDDSDRPAPFESVREDDELRGCFEEMADRRDKYGALARIFLDGAGGRAPTKTDMRTLREAFR